MKGSIFQLFIFFLLFIVIALVVGGSAYLLWYDAGVSPIQSNTDGFFVSLPSFLFYILPFSVLSSCILSLFATLKRKINRFFSGLLILIVGSGIYFFGFSALLHTEVPVSDSSTSYESVFYGGKINPFLRGFVYVERMDPKYAYNVVRENPAQYPSFTFHKKIGISSLKKTVSSKRKISGIEERLAGNPYFTDVFKVPEFLGSFIGDLQKFNREMEKLYNASRYYFIFAVIVQVLFAVSCWSLLRISRWPLVNAFFSLVLIRGLFAFYGVWDTPVVQGKLSFLGPGMVKDNIVSILLLVFAFLLVFIDSIFMLSKRTSKAPRHG